MGGAEPSSELELIISLLPQPIAVSGTDEDDADVEGVVRETALVLLKLSYGQAQSQLESMEQELELLRNMPSPPPQAAQDDVRNGKQKEEDLMWRLDAPQPTGGPDGKGPLLDAGGKVCIPSLSKSQMLTCI